MHVVLLGNMEQSRIEHSAIRAYQRYVISLGHFGYLWDHVATESTRLFVAKVYN